MSQKEGMVRWSPRKKESNPKEGHPMPGPNSAKEVADDILRELRNRSPAVAAEKVSLKKPVAIRRFGQPVAGADLADKAKAVLPMVVAAAMVAAVYLAVKHGSEVLSGLSEVFDAKHGGLPGSTTSIVINAPSPSHHEVTDTFNSCGATPPVSELLTLMQAPLLKACAVVAWTISLTRAVITNDLHPLVTSLGLLGFIMTAPVLARHLLGC